MPLLFAMPAKPGIHISEEGRGARTWTPACAGVTVRR